MRRRPGDRLQLAEVVTQAVDLGVHVLVGDLGVRDRDPEARVARQVQLWADLHHCVEGHRPGFLTGGDVDLGRGDGIDVLVPDGPGVVARQRVAERLLASHVLAQPGLEDPPGGLPGTEARDADLPGDLPKGGVQGPLELLLVDLDRELDLVALEGLDDGFHTRAAVY